MQTRTPMRSHSSRDEACFLRPKRSNGPGTESMSSESLTPWQIIFSPGSGLQHARSQGEREREREREIERLDREGERERERERERPGRTSARIRLLRQVASARRCGLRTPRRPGERRAPPLARVGYRAGRPPPHSELWQ